MLHWNEFLSVGKKTAYAKKCRSKKKKKRTETKTDRYIEQLATMPFLPCTILANKTVESKLELFFLNTVSPFSPPSPLIEALVNFAFTPKFFKNCDEVETSKWERLSPIQRDDADDERVRFFPHLSYKRENPKNRYRYIPVR